ncbi:MAG: S8 family serine peptidase [Euryarchaeota archaeon]|nr:S8 family serine peptidase [Euryarchaeota archaeon]MBT7980136.1 S8 family serine peptidase [Euryarchaeota archaeon]
MRSLEGLELLPEPEDHRILTVVDPTAPGYPGKDYGISDEDAKELRWPAGPIKEFLWPWGAVMFSIGTVFLIVAWPWINAYLAPVLPNSEWAFEETGIRELQSLGLDGSGIHVCIVDTGIDMNHPDFAHQNIVGFRDFYSGQHDVIRDVGEEYHGTLMAGILIANGTFRGAVPNIDLSVALALGPEGSSGQGDKVAQAIRWCRITERVDIISLSLGGESGDGMTQHSATAAAVQEALDVGIFVVAAAGNTGLDTDINDVSTPSSIEGVISVGAQTKSGSVWSRSAYGSQSDPSTGLDRIYPNQKPEIIAPGVNIFSTASTDLAANYAYSSGTSDSTVFVTGALALILQLYGDEIAGDDGVIDASEIDLVKRNLAISANRNDFDTNTHDSHFGYGKLDAMKWAEAIAFELNIDN